MRDAVGASFKKDLKDYLAYMEVFAKKCGARVLLNTEATPELLKAEKYDAIIAAIGAEPIMPKLPGSDKPNVHWAPDAENGVIECGENVVIIGGSSVGTEASVNLAMHGKKVTVIEMAKQVNLYRTGAAADLLKMSQDYNVVRLMGWKLLEIKDGSVLIENVDTGERQEVKADTVLMAVGMQPRVKEAMSFWHCCPETSFFRIGDCNESGDIRDAVWMAFEAARYI